MAEFCKIFAPPDSGNPSMPNYYGTTYAKNKYNLTLVKFGFKEPDYKADKDVMKETYGINILPFGFSRGYELLEDIAEGNPSPISLLKKFGMTFKYPEYDYDTNRQEGCRKIYEVFRTYLGINGATNMKTWNTEQLCYWLYLQIKGTYMLFVYYILVNRISGEYFYYNHLSIKKKFYEELDTAILGIKNRAIELSKTATYTQLTKDNIEENIKRFLQVKEIKDTTDLIYDSHSFRQEISYAQGTPRTISVTSPNFEDIIAYTSQPRKYWYNVYDILSKNSPTPELEYLKNQLDKLKEYYLRLGKIHNLDNQLTIPQQDVYQYYLYR